MDSKARHLEAVGAEPSKPKGTGDLALLYPASETRAEGRRALKAERHWRRWSDGLLASVVDAAGVEVRLYFWF